MRSTLSKSCLAGSPVAAPPTVAALHLLHPRHPRPRVTPFQPATLKFRVGEGVSCTLLLVVTEGAYSPLPLALVFPPY